MAAKVRVWDLPTRLFHWLLVALFGLSWWSAETGQMEWHQMSGISLLALLVFRLLWGFIGGSTARFAAFVKSPCTVIAYLRSGNRAASAGHSPLGGYSVLAMLGMLAVQIIAGLLAVDVDGIESGPLSFLVTFDTARSAAAVHALAFNLMLALIALHVLAILYYTIIARQGLIQRMITGQQSGGPGGLQTASRWRFLIALGLATTLAWWVRGGLEF